MPSCAEGQGFSLNYNPSYQSGGLLGHTGIDVSCGFGTPIHSLFDGIVYKVLTKDNPANDGSGFTGVFMIVDNGVECFEWLVGHCDPCVSEGQEITKGQQIGTEANHGTVYAGNVQITLAMQASGDQRGSHRHYQKRPVMKVTDTSGPCLSARNDLPGFYRDTNGFYYQIFNYGNGFHGCVDPLKTVFQRDLWFGSSGYDVYVLQRFMAKQGLLTVPPTAFFGVKTGAAVSQYQKNLKISPTLGYFGSKTRQTVNIPIVGLLEQ